jgi:beta-lactamase regulating signal transducer with metallopeptidase domain
MVDLLLESALRSLLLGGSVWLGLALLRVRNPRAQMTAWTVVLAASLTMPALMDRVTVTLPAEPPLRVVESIVALSIPVSVPLTAETDAPALPVQAPLARPSAAQPAAVQAPTPAELAAADGRSSGSPAFGWRGSGWHILAAAVYLVVATVMLLRLFAGLVLSRRIVRAARPIHESWTFGADVRVSDAVATPVTFGSAILLPADYAGWSETKRQAVLSHERSHVAHGDFYVLLLAAFNRAVFWFNPLAWWQLVRVAELAEIISDDAALEMLDDRPSYAGILLDLASGLRQTPIAIAMARACTLRKRVERILAGTTVPARIGWRKRTLVATALVPVVVISAGAIGPGVSKPSDEGVAALPDAASVSRVAAIEAGPHPFDRYVGDYELGPLRALAVTRAGDRLILKETGRVKFEMTARGDQAFVSENAGASVIFASDALGRATGLGLQEPGTRARRAVRIDAARAREIENAFARRVAVAPDRFRDQAPADGSKAAVLWAIDDLQHEAPGYGRMSRQLADSVRRQFARLHAMIAALGEVESVFFRGVGPGGYDIYGVKFASGLAEFRILVGVDGTIEDMIFRPDGDGTPGEVAACAQEQILKPAPTAVPIQLLLYNGSGGDVRAFEIDAEGKRSRDVMIGEDRSAPIVTHVGHPWVVADAAGQCLEVIVPGQSTRHLAIPADAREQAARPAPRRTSPLPGSEQALREYIDAVGRGEPDYGAMTPQVAAYTRQDLVLNKAILARLGALRALSFRGVTLNGNDIYVAHFANGSAEWRIALVGQGRIGRLALGPQY